MTDAPNGWRPIDCADGDCEDDVLVTNGEIVTLAYYDSTDLGAWIDLADEERRPMDPQPTLWQPKPEPA